MTEATMETVVDQVRGIGQQLREAGWTVATSVGELATPDRVLWFSATYVSGEYTVHAFHRERGYGVPRGNIRVRITPALVSHHPELGRALADDLVRAADEVRALGFDALLWPPPIWAELSIAGVTDLR